MSGCGTVHALATQAGGCKQGCALPKSTAAKADNGHYLSAQTKVKCGVAKFAGNVLQAQKL